MQKKMVLLEDLSKEQIEAVKKRAPNHQMINSLDEKELKEIDIVLGWNEKLEINIKNEQSQINWIQYPFAGVDHLPLPSLEKMGTQLTTGSGTNSHAVAESTMALILSITRNIIRSSKEQEKSNWFRPEERYELKGKTIMIVGAGKIGEQIGRVCQTFLMNTIGINRSGRTIKYMDEQYLQEDLKKNIHKADIIVNVLPATEETKNLFDQSLFSKMKKETIFVNVGRGETVVTKDLLSALDREEIAWAALDVFEEEPLASNHPLWQHDKVLMTPHIAGQVENQLDYIFPIFLDNLEAYLQGEEFPYNHVEFNQGY